MELSRNKPVVVNS